MPAIPVPGDEARDEPALAEDEDVFLLPCDVATQRDEERVGAVGGERLRPEPHVRVGKLKRLARQVQRQRRRCRRHHDAA